MTLSKKNVSWQVHQPEMMSHIQNISEAKPDRKIIKLETKIRALTRHVSKRVGQKAGT